VLSNLIFFEVLQCVGVQVNLERRAAHVSEVAHSAAALLNRSDHAQCLGALMRRALDIYVYS